MPRGRSILRSWNIPRARQRGRSPVHAGARARKDLSTPLTATAIPLFFQEVSENLVQELSASGGAAR